MIIQGEGAAALMESLFLLCQKLPFWLSGIHDEAKVRALDRLR